MSQCVNFKIAKVFVNADFSKELSKAMKFTTSSGKEALVEFTYPLLPSRCLRCEKWSHVEKTCLTNGDPKEGIVGDKLQNQVVTVQTAVNSVVKGSEKSANAMNGACVGSASLV